MKKRPVRWNDLMDEYLLTKRSKGEPFHEIASALGVRRACVMRRYRIVCAEKGVERFNWRNGKHAIQTRRKVIEMKVSGRKLTEIAAIVGLDVNQAAGIWYRWRASA